MILDKILLSNQFTQMTINECLNSIVLRVNIDVKFTNKSRFLPDYLSLSDLELNRRRLTHYLIDNC